MIHLHLSSVEELTAPRLNFAAGLGRCGLSVNWANGQRLTIESVQITNTPQAV